MTMDVPALIKRAQSQGVHQSWIDDAAKQPNHKAALIAVLLQPQSRAAVADDLRAYKSPSVGFPGLMIDHVPKSVQEPVWPKSIPKPAAPPVIGGGSMMREYVPPKSSPGSVTPDGFVSPDTLVYPEGGASASTWG